MLCSGGICLAYCSVLVAPRLYMVRVVGAGRQGRESGGRNVVLKGARRDSKMQIEKAIKMM